ncbi:MAG: hypothetical protein CK425_11550 [Parachlamydia sp.]|nr:MAG: hypothetical protein CK425_11550 [Parachlamydia sp.]
MSSYDYNIGKYTVELGLAVNLGWQFDKEGKIAPQGIEPISKKIVLDKILYVLERARVYSIDQQNSRKFLHLVAQYAKLADAQEVSKVQRISKKINTLVQQQSNRVPSCFTSSFAKKVNRILDLDCTRIDHQEYIWLYDLANLLAVDRLNIHQLYQKAAIQAKMSELLEKSPDIRITPGEVTSYRFTYQHPTEAADCQLSLAFECHLKKDSDLSKVDPQLIKWIIQRKVESIDLNFRIYLDQALALYVCHALGVQWDELEQELVAQKALVDYANNHINKSVRMGCCQGFLSHPLSFGELVREKSSASSFYDRSRLPPIAKEVYEHALATHEAYDQWYQAIYEKIAAYKHHHPDATLPFMNMEEFSFYKTFVSKDDIRIPLVEQFEKWTEEAREVFEKTKAPAKVLSKKTLKKRKEKFKKKSPDVISPEAPSSLKEEAVSGEKEAPSQKVYTDPSVPEIAQSQFIDEPLVQTSIHELLLKSSPFAVKKRITDWFDTIASVKILNEESVFIHTFAWAAQVIWDVGLRYYHFNDRGEYQPAIAILCDVVHPLFPKPELFLMTVTFDHKAGKSNLDPDHLFDPTWECYHRTLTRREQASEVVADYLEIANDFREFPPLPSQAKKIVIRKELEKRIYPDRSYIHSVEGGVITIRDPKHDRKYTPCVLRLYPDPSNIRLLA